MVQGWPELFFKFKLNTYMSESPNYYSFSIMCPPTLTHFCQCHGKALMLAAKRKVGRLHNQFRIWRHCGAIPNWTSLILEWTSVSVSSHVNICFRNLFPSSSVQSRWSADTRTGCALWSNISIFGTHCTHTSIKNKCSQIIESTLPTLLNTVAAF